MTTKERNRDIKRLAKAIKNFPDTDKTGKTAYEFIDGYAKKEFIRLHNADNSFQSLSNESILLLIGLNRTYRFIPFHRFGLGIDYKELI